MAKLVIKFNYFLVTVLFVYLSSSAFVVAGNNFLDETSNSLVSSPVYYRHLLYQQQTQQTTGLLSQLLVEEKYQRLGAYLPRVGLMKSQLYIEKGLYSAADNILKDLLDTHKQTAEHDAWLLNQARFYYAKSLYHQSRLEESYQLLQQVTLNIEPELRAELQHYTSLILMKQGQYKQAIAYIRKYWWQAPGQWDLMTRLNLSLALIRSNHNEGYELLKSLVKHRVAKNKVVAVTGDVNAYQMESALIDKAYQSLGFLYLNADNAASALYYLQKVSLDGPYSNLALLGAGWASVGKGSYAQATIPWRELQQKDIRQQAVQESLLSLPYAYERLGETQHAIRYYQHAIKRFENEQSALTKTIKQLKTPVLSEELNRLQVSSGKTWYQTLALAKQGGALRYLYQLNEDQVFAELLRMYREARLVKENADNKIAKVSRLQQELLTGLGVGGEAAKSTKRDQIKFIEILSANLLKQSNQLQTSAEQVMEDVTIKIRKRSLALLQQKLADMDVYLVQSRLALAQNIELLK